MHFSENLLWAAIICYFYPQFCLIKIITKVLNWAFIVRFAGRRRINNLEVYSLCRKGFVSLKVRCRWMTKDLRGRLEMKIHLLSWHLKWKFYWKLRLNFYLIVKPSRYINDIFFRKHNLIHGIFHFENLIVQSWEKLFVSMTWNYLNFMVLSCLILSM